MSDRHQDNLPIDPVIRAALNARQVHASDSCVDPETLAAWCDAGLDPSHAAAVDAHLADCPRCQAILATLSESSGSETVGAGSGGGVVVPFEKPSRLRWIAPVAAGVAAAGIIFWMVQPASDSSSAPTTALAEQSAPQVAAPSPGAASSAAPESSPATGIVANAKSAPAPRPPASRETAPPRPTPMPLAMSPVPLPAAAQPGSSVALGGVPLPPTPAATPSPSVAADSALARADRNAMKFEAAPKKYPIEFGPPAQAAGRGGGGGGRTTGAAALRTTNSIPLTIRWRILESGRVERTVNSGDTWTSVALEAPVFITAGAAPAPAVCWLVGRDGAVFRSIDGATFIRVDFPNTLDLESVTAQNADRATVSTRDGRTFSTTDGGHTWRSN